MIWPLNYVTALLCSTYIPFFYPSTNECTMYILPALQCGGSGMFIPDPGSWFLPIPDPGSRIPDQKTATKERGEKTFDVIPFYVATNFTKLYIILVLKCWRKKFGPIFKKLWNFLPKKLSLNSPKYGFGIRDPRSGKNLFRIPGSKRHRIPDPDPQHCCPVTLLVLPAHHYFLLHVPFLDFSLSPHQSTSS